MKKFFGIFTAVFTLTAISFSCQKAEFDEPKAEQTFDKVETILTALLEPRTKVALDFPKLSWEDQDKIAVFDGKDPQPNEFIYVAEVEEEESEGEAVTRATVVRPNFSGVLTEGAEALYAEYPYNADATYADGKITTTIPAEQVIPTNGNVDKSALLCVATTTTDELAFKNVLGLVKITVPSGMSAITKITISGANDEDVIAGTGAITVNDTPSFTATDAKKVVTLTHADGGFPKGDYYVAVAPVKFANGFSVSFAKADGKAQTKSTEKANEVVRNGGLNVGDQLTNITWEYIISTKTELFAWNEDYESWTKNDVVKLGADIDMENEAWTPRNFSGTFDGQNHKLYNYHVSRDGFCGLFYNLSGTVKNLVIGSKDGLTYDGSSIVESAHVSSTAWGHVGSVASFLATGGKIENVKNFAKIFIKDQNKPKCCFGGLVGSSDGPNNEIKNCENHGEIVHEAAGGQTTGASNHQCGGIIGKTDGKIIIDGCKNYGTITISGDKVDIVGGIIGNPNGGGAANKSDDIKNCYNYGAINITKTTSSVSPMALGGIVGKLTGATLTNCHNYGTISSVCDVLTGIGGVAGIHKLAHESKISGCSNGVQNDATKGILTFNPAGATQQMALGGILGYSEDYQGKLTLESCSNYAPISSSYNAMRNIGGVVGAIGKVTAKDGEKSTIELLIDKCHNYGAITIGGSGSISDWQRHIGGIAGMLYGSETEAGLTVSGCTNNASISTTATGGGEHRIAGIVGHIKYGKILISGCTNNGEVKATGKAQNPRPAGIVSVVNAGTSLSISNCCNKAKLTNTSSTGTLFAGGIVAYLIGTTISACQNEGAIEVTNCGGAAKIGGIVGADNSTASTISTCVNKGQILYSHTQQPYVGGILGYAGVASKISGCTNEMTDTGWDYFVRCASTNKVMVGGILGFNEGKAVEVTGCTNNGIVIGENTTSCSNYICVGGICGRINSGAAKVSDNTCGTLSHVKLIANTTNQLANSGGIIGGVNPAGTVSNNINYGKVTATNAADGKTAYAGGIIGGDNEGTVDATFTMTFTDNKNYGLVTAKGQDVTLGTVGAGGLIGTMRHVFTSIDANVNYGNVVGEGGNKGGAGAVCGYMEATKATCPATVYSGVLVNNVAYSSVKDNSIKLMQWYCPLGNFNTAWVTITDIKE